MPVWASVILSILPTATSIFAAWMSVQIGLTELRDAQRLQEVQWRASLEKLEIMLSHDATQKDEIVKKLTIHEQRLDDYEYYLRHNGKTK